MWWYYISLRSLLSSQSKTDCFLGLFSFFFFFFFFFQLARRQVCGFVYVCVFVFWLKVANWLVVAVRERERRALGSRRVGSFVLHPKAGKLWVFVWGFGGWERRDLKREVLNIIIMDSSDVKALLLGLLGTLLTLQAYNQTYMDTTYCMLLGFVVLLVAWGVKEGVIPLWNKQTYKQTKLSSCSRLGRSWRTHCVWKKERNRNY